MIPITAIILAKNEEHTLPRVLASVAFCAERLVVDDNSMDKTKEIAMKQGARVLTHTLNGDFSAQRTYAAEQATENWVLFLDADEVLSDTLQKELQDIFSSEKKPEASAMRLRRRDFFWRSELKHGETKKARTHGFVRLARKGTGTWHGTVHEELHVDGTIQELSGYINHYPHPTISAFLTDINKYSTIRAHELTQKKHPWTLAELILFPLGKFLQTYVWKQGFRDGLAGFVYSFLMSFHSFLVRAKHYQYTSIT